MFRGSHHNLPLIRKDIKHLISKYTSIAVFEKRTSQFNFTPKIIIMKTLKLSCLLLMVLFFQACSDDDNEDSSANCSTVCEYTLEAGQDPGSVPAGLHGELNLVLDLATPQSPFPEGTTATFTVSETEMTVEIEGEECITLRNPYRIPGTTEDNFVDDCRDNYIFGISGDQNGNLNEINLGSIAGGSIQFLGQFK